jgi:NitT/TauT family transport system substrate-binding protein
MRLALPDLISNSYFPAVAAIELGFFAEERLNVELEVIFPVDKAYAALRDGRVDLVAGAAHAALAAFPSFKGVKLLCAQAQGMYWFLVMHKELGARRGELDVVKGRSIGAAPWVEMGLRRLLIEAGLDLSRDGIRIVPVAPPSGTGINFGLAAAQALEDRRIDGFWANGMGAEIAVTRGVGTVVIDARRRDGPAAAFHYTFASIAGREEWILDERDRAAALVRAISKAHAALRRDVSLAAEVGRRLFPRAEAELIATVVGRDLPYYDVSISRSAIRGLKRFARDLGILKYDIDDEDILIGPK